MKNNGTTLRKMVVENALELGRVSKDVLGDDYDELTTLYQNTLDVLTEWASKDYAHISESTDKDNAFDSIKNILNLFATDENKIIIDQSALRTLRDCATKPKRLYSDEYKDADKIRKEQAKTVTSRYDDLLTLGAPSRNDNETTAEYVQRVRKSGINVISENIDMLSMYENAVATLAVKTKKVEDIKAKGKWTWRRPISVSVNDFAELVENYIADCLIDNYNLKSSKTIREEKIKAREEKKANKTK